MDERRIFRARNSVRDACRLIAIPILIPLGLRSLVNQQSRTVGEASSLCTPPKTRKPRPFACAARSWPISMRRTKHSTLIRQIGDFIFALAAHLEPEILIVDEVLAVGDVQFQQKCLGKMDQVANRDGRTVLFVSHNMGAIQALCHRGICIESGTMAVDTAAIPAVNFYLKGFEHRTSPDLLSVRELSGKGEIRLARVDVLSENGERLWRASGQPQSCDDIRCGGRLVRRASGSRNALWDRNDLAPLDNTGRFDRFVTQNLDRIFRCRVL